MSIALTIKASYELPNLVVNSYLQDLLDEELFVRPAEGMNHIAWQLGHLISSEYFHISQVCPGSMPPLPAGFAERHTKHTAPSDDRDGFCSKSEYLKQMTAQRSGTLSILSGLSDDELQQPSPESIRYFGPTVGSVFAGETTHWMMHAGQWAVVRRRLGKPPLF